MAHAEPPLLPPVRDEDREPPEPEPIPAEWEEDEQGTPCPMCGGDLGLLGPLGSAWWFRCRACGMDCSGDGPTDAELDDMAARWEAGRVHEGEA